jgi:glycosyltransferase involved in cell wall biosynthesis
VEFERDSRYKGKSAYNFWKIIKLSLDGIISTSNMPLKFSTTVGFAVSTMAFIGAIITLIQKIITYYYPDSFLSVYPGFSTIVLSILFLGGVQLISIGLLGEYIARVYNDVKGRPLFLIKEIIGFENNELHYD